MHWLHAVLSHWTRTRTYTDVQHLESASCACLERYFQTEVGGQMSGLWPSQKGNNIVSSVLPSISASMLYHVGLLFVQWMDTQQLYHKWFNFLLEVTPTGCSNVMNWGWTCIMCSLSMNTPGFQLCATIVEIVVTSVQSNSRANRPNQRNGQLPRRGRCRQCRLIR